MAKTFTIDLPITQTRELRYTRQERIEFEKRFRDRGLSGMREIIEKLVLPTVDVGGGKRDITLGGDLEAQEALVYLGLRHIGNVITERRVSDWLTLAATEEGPQRQMVAFVAPAVAAVYASGILGFVYEHTVEVEPVDPKAEATAGTP